MTADLLFVDHEERFGFMSPVTPVGQARISANKSGARRWGADSRHGDVEHYANRSASDGLRTRIR